MNTQIVLTEAGHQAMFTANNSGLAAEIVAVGLGDAAYAVATNSDGRTGQTALQHEIDRVNLRYGQRVSQEQLDITFTVETEQAYWVNEIGFYLADDTLFGVWSDAATPFAYKAVQTPLVIGLSWLLGSLGQHDITVHQTGAPLELLMTKDLAVIGTALANLQLQQLRQNDRITALEQAI